MPERDDHHTYGGVMFYRDTLEFFLQALRFYEDLLKSDVQAINDDPDLKLFLTPSDEEKLPVHEELGRIGRIREWLSERLSGDGWVIHLPISHGTVRLLKSVSELYMSHLQARRNALAARPNLSKQALEAVDQRLAAVRSKSTTGVFSEATVRPLLVDQAVPASAQGDAPAQASLAVTAAPRPVLLSSIEVLDPELRTRCLDLFGQFTETGQHDRLDTVISEATRILERQASQVVGRCDLHRGRRTGDVRAGRNESEGRSVVDQCRTRRGAPSLSRRVWVHTQPHPSPPHHRPVTRADPPGSWHHRLSALPA